MKNKLKRTLKLLSLLIGLSLLLNNCEKSESLIEETIGNNSLNRISLSEFNLKITQDESYHRLSNMFDVNKYKLNNSTQNRLSLDNDFTVLTNDILVIQNETIVSYTFKIITASSNNEFYNLVIQVNDQQEIIKSEIFEYSPTDLWLSDISQPYSGYISLFNNNVIDLDLVFSQKISGLCVTSVSAIWNCNYNREHAPNTPGTDCTSWEYIITPGYGPCSTPEEKQYFLEDSDSSSSGSGGGNGTSTTNTGSSSTQPMPPCDEAQNGFGTSADGGCLSADENTIIDCVGYTTSLMLLSPVEKNDIANFITQNGCTAVNTTFINAAIETLIDDGEVDFEENIIYDNSLNNYPCQKIVIQDAIGVCSPLTQAVLNAFESNDGTNLIFEVSNSITSNGNTSSSSVYDPNTSTCNITIKIRQSYLETATDLSIARTVIHESLHAMFVYMFEEGLLTSSNGTPLDGFSDLVEAHINYLSGLPANLGVAHHILMTDFVEDMATSLSIYASSMGYSNSFNFYKNLCWSGAMLNTPTFQSLYPQYLNPSDATNNPDNINPDWLDILNTNAAEQDNSTYTFAHPNGTTYTNSPVGSAPNSTEPCN